MIWIEKNFKVFLLDENKLNKDIENKSMKEIFISNKNKSRCL